MKPIYLKHVEASQTLLINEQSRLMQSEGRKIYKFGFGQSPFPPPDHVVEALQQQAKHNYYSPVQGDPELCEKIAQFHSQMQKLDIQAKDVLVATGSKILIFNIMASFTKASILIPAPAWVSYEPQAKLLGHEIVRILSNYKSHWRITPEMLEQALASRQDKDAQSILILTYPGNPDGLNYRVEELQALAEVARRENILVISDEIYGFINHTGGHRSIAEFYPEGTVITSAMSKWCGAGGWRIGVAILPKTAVALRESLLGMPSETYACASTPLQMAAIEAYNLDERIKTYLHNQRRILSLIGNASHQRLVKAGLHVHAPEGGFYLFVDFMPHKEKLAARGIHNSEALCTEILARTGVALIPSVAFGMPSDHLSARLAYVDFDGNAALVAAAQQEGKLDETFLQNNAKHTMAGIDALANFVTYNNLD